MLVAVYEGRNVHRAVSSVSHDAGVECSLVTPTGTTNIEPQVGRRRRMTAWRTCTFVHKDTHPDHDGMATRFASVF